MWAKVGLVRWSSVVVIRFISCSENVDGNHGPLRIKLQKILAERAVYVDHTI